MTVYLTQAGFFAAAAIFELVRLLRFPRSRAAKIINELALAAGLLSTVFVAGFRLDTGYDYVPYLRSFLETAGKTVAELAKLRTEKGYLLLNLFAGYLSNNISVIFICVAALIAAILYIGLKSMTRYPSTGLLAFYLFGFFFNSMNFHRNFIAATIVFAAYAFLRGPGHELSVSMIDEPGGANRSTIFTDGLSADERLRSFVRYAALVLTASAFHRSALLMLPFWFILRIRINLISAPVYLAAGGVILYFAMPLMRIITSYIYKEHSPEFSADMLKGIPVTYSLCLGVVFAIAFFWRKRFYRSAWDTVLISASFFAFYFEFVGSRHSILGRFTMYFGPVTAMVLVPELTVFCLRLLVKTQTPQTASSGGTDPAIAAHDRMAEPERNFTRGINKAQKAAAVVSLIFLAAAAVTFFAYALTHNYNRVVPHEWIWNLYD